MEDLQWFRWEFEYEERLFKGYTLVNVLEGSEKCLGAVFDNACMKIAAMVRSRFRIVEHYFREEGNKDRYAIVRESGKKLLK